MVNEEFINELKKRENDSKIIKVSGIDLEVNYPNNEWLVQYETLCNPMKIDIDKNKITNSIGEKSKEVNFKQAIKDIKIDLENATSNIIKAQKYLIEKCTNIDINLLGLLNQDELTIISEAILNW